MAAGSRGEYEVVFQRVAVRDAPATDARIVGALFKGDVVRGTRIDLENGDPWLRLARSTELASGPIGDEDSAWVLIDASNTPLGLPPLGLGLLLRLLVPAEQPEAGAGVLGVENEDGKVQVRVHCLNGTIFEVLVDDFANVLDLQVAIETASGIPRRELRLVHGSNLLNAENWENLLKTGKDGVVELSLVRRDPTQARWLVQVQQDWAQLEHCPEECRSDREIVMAAVHQCWEALALATEELRADRELVLAAVRQDGRALKYACWGPRSDVEVVATAARQHWRAIEWAAPELLANRAVVEAALVQNPAVLERASAELREDRDLVLKAVRQDGTALGFAGAGPRADKEVALAALRDSSIAMDYVADALRADPEVKKFAEKARILNRARKTPGILQQAKGELLVDPEIALALAAVKQHPNVLVSALKDLTVDRDVVLAAVKQDGLLLEHADKCFREDREVAIAAVCQTSEAFRLVAPSLQKDPKLALLAELRHPSEGVVEAFREAPRKLRSDLDVIRAAAAGAAEVLELVPEQLRDNREIVLAAVRAHGHALRFASKRLRFDCQVVGAALKQDRSALEHAAAEYQDRREDIEAAASDREVDRILVSIWGKMSSAH